MIRTIRNLLSALTLAIESATEQRRNEFLWFKSHGALATKQDLEQMEKRIMSKITAFFDAQNAFNARQETATTELNTAFTGLSEDIQGLKDLIGELQTNPGDFSPEDEATATALLERSEAIVTKLETVSAALKALNEATPPKVPNPPA